MVGVSVTWRSWSVGFRFWRAAWLGSVGSFNGGLVDGRGEVKAVVGTARGRSGGTVRRWPLWWWRDGNRGDGLVGKPFTASGARAFVGEALIVRYGCWDARPVCARRSSGRRARG